jgi:hypothetical protein
VSDSDEELPALEENTEGGEDVGGSGEEDDGLLLEVNADSITGQGGGAGWGEEGGGRAAGAGSFSDEAELQLEENHEGVEGGPPAIIV